MKTKLLLIGILAVMMLPAVAQTSTAPAFGSGTSTDPYQIATLDNLYWLSQNNSYWSNYFIQTANIDASSSSSWNNGNGFSSIGNNITKFTGHYNGKGHTINSLYIKRSSSYIALFGYALGANIDSLGLVGITITGNQYVGGLVGVNNTSSISNCYSSGKITGLGNDVGGLVGYNYNSSSVFNSYSTGNVSGIDHVGGLVGYNYNSTVTNSYSTNNVLGSIIVGGVVGYNYYSSTVTNCYSTGNVSGGFSGNSSVGGVVGVNSTSSAVTNCYSSGSVSGSGYIGGMLGWNSTSSSSITNCYWDTQTSGKTIGCGYNSGIFTATGLSTIEMKNSANLSNIGSFSTLWKIRNDSTYPALRSVNNNAPFAFTDSVKTTASISLAKLLYNDFDYESLQSKLTFKVVGSTTHVGSVSNNVYTFNTGMAYGSADTVVYRVGEIVAVSDTLWGNQATSRFIYYNNKPIVSSVADTSMRVNTTLTLTVKDNVLASDTDGDALSIVVFGGNNYTVKDSTVTPTRNFYGTLSVPIAVTDGKDTSTVDTIKITVKPKDIPLIIWENPAAITYGTALGSTQLNATANIEGHFDYNPASGLVLDAGNNQQLVVTFTPTDTTNYTEASDSVKITINKATPKVRWTDPADITYGTPLSSTQLNATANVPGTFTYSPPEGTILSVGNKQLLITVFSPTYLINYEVVKDTAIININSAVGISTPKATNNVALYPNPTTDAFQVTGIEGSATLILSDLNGRLLFTKEVTAGETVSVSAFPNGVYLATIKSKYLTETEKIVIQH
jgi:hypothetical protein